MLTSRIYINVRYARSKQYVVKRHLYRSSGKFYKGCADGLRAGFMKYPKAPA